jgi:hypothetical protein
MIISDDGKWRLYNKHDIALARDFNCAPRGVNYAPKVALKIVSALTKAYSVVIYYL